MIITAWNGWKRQIYEGIVIPFNDECSLFRSNGGKRWFLHYSAARNTGAFKTKKAAMEWYNKGGR